jgi:putative RNA 2'-phosphotransferase
VRSILATGLERRRRQYVHLSADRGTARRVGSRRGQPVILSIDAAAMAAVISVDHGAPHEGVS